MLYQRPLTVVSDCIRGMLCAAPGNTLFSADFSAVEARGLAWLAGQEDVIRAFRDGVDIYNHAASGIFGRPIDRKKHLRSAEHTSELQALMRNSYAVLCLK